MSIKDIVLRNKFLAYFIRCVKGYEYRGRDEYQCIPEIDRRGDFFNLKKYGNSNPDRVFYSINIEGGPCGFFAIYRRMIQFLYICEKLNFEPYIYIYNSHYNDNSNQNVFDFFFEQPANITSDELHTSSWVIESTDSHIKWMDINLSGSILLAAGYEVSESLIDELARINRKYIRIRNEIKVKLDNEISELLGKRKTVAVQYRGNAFSVGFKGHPIKVGIEQYYDHIDACLGEGYEQVFVATDEEDILNTLIEKYGIIIKFYKDTFRSNNGIDIHDQRIMRENNGFTMAYEVYRDVITMCSCDSLICGNSQVTIATRIIKRSNNERFEHETIIDNGIYMKNNNKRIKQYVCREEFRR